MPLVKIEKFRLCLRLFLCRLVQKRLGPVQVIPAQELVVREEQGWEAARDLEDARIHQHGAVQTLEPVLAHFTALKVGAIQAELAFALGTRVATLQDLFTIAPIVSLIITQVIAMVGKLSLVLINLVFVTIELSNPNCYLSIKTS